MPYPSSNAIILSGYDALSEFLHPDELSAEGLSAFEELKQEVSLDRMIIAYFPDKNVHSIWTSSETKDLVTLILRHHHLDKSGGSTVKWDTVSREVYIQDHWSEEQADCAVLEAAKGIFQEKLVKHTAQSSSAPGYLTEGEADNLRYLFDHPEKCTAFIYNQSDTATQGSQEGTSCADLSLGTLSPHDDARLTEKEHGEFEGFPGFGHAAPDFTEIQPLTASHESLSGVIQHPGSMSALVLQVPELDIVSSTGTPPRRPLHKRARSSGLFNVGDKQTDADELSTQFKSLRMLHAAETQSSHLQ